MRVLKYLRFSCDYGLHYTRYPIVIEGYSDANWISNVKDSNLIVVISLHLEVQQYHGNPQNKRLLSYP